MLTQIAGIISLLNSSVTLAKNTMDVITTIKSKLYQDAKSEIISHKISYAPYQEVIANNAIVQPIVTNVTSLIPTLTSTQNLINEEFLFTKPIITPEKLRLTMGRDPKSLLYDITDYNIWKKQVDHAKDPTLLPVLFPDGNNRYIGWIKTGYLNDYFSLEYRPQDKIAEDVVARAIISGVSINSVKKELTVPRKDIVMGDCLVVNPETVSKLADLELKGLFFLSMTLTGVQGRPLDIYIYLIDGNEPLFYTTAEFTSTAFVNTAYIEWTNIEKRQYRKATFRIVVRPKGNQNVRYGIALFSLSKK